MHFGLVSRHKLLTLSHRIKQSEKVTPQLMRELIEAVFGRVTEDTSGQASAVWRMARAEAYVDAALALIDTALPDWSVRRICYEDGEWWCAMNPRQPVYWEDDEVDEAHPVMALAILKAFVTALSHRRFG